MALEAKATMTEHQKSLPRLHDELDSSHATIHGSTSTAIAIGVVLINVAESFISTGKVKESLAGELARAPRNLHKQPQAAERVIKKVMQLRRRSDTQNAGFDALGALAIRLSNDFSLVERSDDAFAELREGGVLNYASMIQRISGIYNSRYPMA